VSVRSAIVEPRPVTFDGGDCGRPRASKGVYDDIARGGKGADQWLDGGDWLLRRMEVIAGIGLNIA